LIEGGDNEDVPSTIIFAEVPDGIYSLLIYSVARPLEFPTVDFEQVESGQRIYMTQENADAYNANPGFRQVSSTDPENRGEGNFVRFDNITPVDGEVTLNFWDEGDDTANSTINAMQLIETPGDPLRFTDIRFHSATRNVDLTWTSREGRTYTMARSTDLSNWQELTDGIESGGDTTSYTNPNVPADLDPVYYQVTEE
jgi:hypothetical protein